MIENERKKSHIVNIVQLNYSQFRIHFVVVCKRVCFSIALKQSLAKSFLIIGGVAYYENPVQCFNEKIILQFIQIDIDMYSVSVPNNLTSDVCVRCARRCFLFGFLFEKHHFLRDSLLLYLRKRFRVGIS